MCLFGGWEYLILKKRICSNLQNNLRDHKFKLTNSIVLTETYAIKMVIPITIHYIFDIEWLGRVISSYFPLKQNLENGH